MTKSLDQILAEMENERSLAMRSAEEMRHVIRDRCLKEDITKIIIEFDGSGDSGSIHSILMEKNGDTQLVTLEPEDFHKQVEDWGYQYLSGTGVDWYNNDGGYGEIIFDLTQVPFKFEASIEQRYTESRNAHSEEEIL